MFEQVTALLQPLAADVVKCTLDLAIEIAREGREGRRIGTLFTLGAHKAVLEHSRSLILDPLAGHPEENRRISGTGPIGRGIRHLRHRSFCRGLPVPRRAGFRSESATRVGGASHGGGSDIKDDPGCWYRGFADGYCAAIQVRDLGCRHHSRVMTAGTVFELLVRRPSN
jgi:hypothetical protein